jgi:hypothetical protein
VLANLLTNAARYTPPGGNITLIAREASGEITLTVSDDGEGIDASMLSSIFEMFVQGHQEADRSEGGLGLGLTLVKHLVERHGGVVVADSPGLGHGSTFSVRLPSRAPGASEPPLPGPMLQDTKRVLVVDDNVEAAELMAELLQTLGHEVDVAHDGSEALRAFERFKPQVAVLDIGLPAMDGYELAGCRGQNGSRFDTLFGKLLKTFLCEKNVGRRCTSAILNASKLDIVNLLSGV